MKVFVCLYMWPPTRTTKGGASGSKHSTSMDLSLSSLIQGHTGVWWQQPSSGHLFLDKRS